LTAIPGVLEYGGAEIQILDLPGIIEGAAEGKGRGRQVISAAKTSDLILMILDATKKAEQRALLEAELEAVGIRLNREPPYVIPDFLTQTTVVDALKEHLLETKDRWRDEDHFPKPSQEHRPENGL
jgi:ribosome-interacting GTPase 1